MRATAAIKRDPPIGATSPRACRCTRRSEDPILNPIARRLRLVTLHRVCHRGGFTLQSLERCDVDSIGNDVAWPLFCEQAGLSVGYVEADALTYRTNEAYARDLDDQLDHDPVSWARRVQIAWIQVEAMLPYLEHR